MERLRGRRRFLGATVAGLVAQAVPHRVTATEGEATPWTFTYKTVGDLAIQADVYGATRRERRPVAVWIHGGALIMGDRHGIDGTLLTELLSAGYVVVSIDYRLAPETKLAAILEDVRDALGWVRTEGPREFGARGDRVIVLGSSAGGYLTLVTGFLVKPRPAALVSFWGYGDIAGAWYSRPDPFYRRQPLVPEADARAAIGRRVIAEPPPGNQRSRFYLYCRQNSLWPREVLAMTPMPSRGPSTRSARSATSRTDIHRRSWSTGRRTPMSRTSSRYSWTGNCRATTSPTS